MKDALKQVFNGAVQLIQGNFVFEPLNIHIESDSGIPKTFTAAEFSHSTISGNTSRDHYNLRYLRPKELYINQKFSELLNENDEFGIQTKIICVPKFSKK